MICSAVTSTRRETHRRTHARTHGPHPRALLPSLPRARARRTTLTLARARPGRAWSASFAFKQVSSDAPCLLAGPFRSVPAQGPRAPAATAFDGRGGAERLVPSATYPPPPTPQIGVDSNSEQPGAGLAGLAHGDAATAHSLRACVWRIGHVGPAAGVQAEAGAGPTEISRIQPKTCKSAGKPTGNSNRST